MKKYNQADIENLVKMVVKSQPDNTTPDELMELCKKEIYSQYKPTKKVLFYINYNLSREILRNITIGQFLTGKF